LSTHPVALPLDPAAAELTPLQRGLMVAGVLALHGVGAWGLMQVDAVRAVVVQTAPMFFSLIVPAAPSAPAPLPPPPAQPKKAPPPEVPVPVVAALPSPAPAAFVVPAPPPEPTPAPPASVPALPVAAAPTPPAPAPAPKWIPAAAVQYLVPPVLIYPRLSERNGERGRVMVRVFIDASGLPQDVQIGSSSGFARLDAAALAAVRQARFKPYSENGQPTAGWAVVPASFE
jgi:protein TonB